MYIFVPMKSEKEIYGKIYELFCIYGIKSLTMDDIASKLGISKKTILVIFSDHGTSVGEKKGEKFYGVYLYEYTLNVFAIIQIPNPFLPIFS